MSAAWIYDSADHLQNTFYVTETAATKYQTVYYSHKAWMEAIKPHFERLQQSNLVEISKVTETLPSSHDPG
jgi:telomerase reverse transcriptase